MVQVLCGRCGKEFYGKPSHIAMGYNKYCSRKCSFESMRTGKLFKCEGCGKEVYRTPKYINASKSKKYFCDKSCQTKWRNQYFSGPLHTNWTTGMHSYRSAIKRSGKEMKCEVCDVTDERILAVHHKDRVRTNNDPNNLAWLCHNCHFLVHHYDVGRDRGLLVEQS